MRRSTIAAVVLLLAAVTGCQPQTPLPTFPTVPPRTSTAPAPTAAPTTAPTAPPTSTPPSTSPVVSTPPVVPGPPVGEPLPPKTTTPPPPTTQPPPPPPPPAPGVPVGSRLIFDGSFDGGLGGYATVQTFDRNGSPGGYSSRAVSVRDGGPGHESAARFEVRPGDVPEFGGGERAELRAPDEADVRAGDIRFYQFSLMFPEGFRGPEGRNSGYHSMVMQWHAGSDSPPLHLSLDADGRLGLGHRWDDDRRLIGPAPDGQWHDYVLRVQFGRPDGRVTVWRDGQLVVPTHTRTTMASSSNYLKLGLYRGSEDFPQVVWHDGLRVTAP